MTLESTYVLGFLLAVFPLVCGMIMIHIGLCKYDSVTSALRCHKLISKLELHQNQIKTRQHHLMRYDFQKFNLSESLVWQMEPKH
ncbi:MAG TPA: hypothetical protein DIV44_14225 [Leeuwenhoekiella sp.]|nr:hypothetical protein [Leeuwenhoekiella sp.]MBH13417.1 hypothetical protein [Leeuwenhoekiella sp.]HBO29014.1 hypothetical protein [Leeuwenhoekiella sp.]HCQ77962.1 hypothetical protein [Leeuwenhoekiella sp.]